MKNSVQELIEFTYGRNANLYDDVLRIPRNATRSEVQSAFFDRRYELYETLQNTSGLNNSSVTGNSSVVSEDNGSVMSISSRHFAEKKMDAVIAAFRILSDPVKRRQYNATLQTREVGTVGPSPPNPDLNNTSNSSLSTSSPLPSSPTSPLQPSSVKKVSSRKSRQTPKSKSRQTPKSKSKIGPPSASSPIESTSVKIITPPNYTDKDDDNESVYSTGSVDSDVIASRLAMKQRMRSHQPAPQVLQEEEEEDDDTTVSDSSRSSYFASESDGETQKPKKKRDSRGKRGSHESLRRKNTPEDEDFILEKEEKALSAAMEKSRGCLGINDDDAMQRTLDSGCVGILRNRGMVKEASMLEDVQNEVTGSIADTLLAVDQVWNAFTIADDDIDALASKIQLASDEWFYDDDKHE